MLRRAFAAQVLRGKAAGRDEPRCARFKEAQKGSLILHANARRLFCAAQPRSPAPPPFLKSSTQKRRKPNRLRRNDRTIDFSV